MLEYWKKVYTLHSKNEGYKLRINRAINIVIHAHNKHNKCFVCFSGGKDSLAVLLLFRSIGLDIDVFHRADSLDFPDLANYCKSICKEIGFNYYEIWNDTLTEFSNSGFNKNFKMKTPDEARKFARKNNYDCAFVGLRKEESKGRKWHLMKGDFNDDGITNIYPVKDLKGIDIMTFILESKSKWFHIYDKYNPPHDGRLAWMVNPRVSHYVGDIHFLKIHYPNQYNKLVKINPIIKCYV